MASASEPSVIDGMIQNWAIGPIRNAVIGDGGRLEALGEPEHAALFLERHDLLDDRLLGRLGDRDEHEVDEEADGERQDLGPDREHDRDGPHDDVREQQRPDRVAPRPARATTMPPTMKPRLVNAIRMPHASTDISVSP